MSPRRLDGEPVAFAFFHNYSTWRGRRGLYLEDSMSDRMPADEAAVAILTQLAALATMRLRAWSGLCWTGIAARATSTSRWALDPSTAG